MDDQRRITGNVLAKCKNIQDVPKTEGSNRNIFKMNMGRVLHFYVKDCTLHFSLLFCCDTIPFKLVAKSVH